MTKLIVAWILTLCTLVVIIEGCKDLPTGQNTTPSTVGKLNGRIVDQVTGTPLSGVTLEYSSELYSGSVTTASDGTFEVEFDFARKDATSLSGSITLKKSGYKDQFLSFVVQAGKTTKLFPDPVTLARDTTTTIGGGGGGGALLGTAHSIAFISATSREIDVYGVGGTESTILTFEVRDSLGFPITIDRRDTVTFELIGTPLTGSAYVSPASAISNAAGRVATTVNSGTVSGVLQFVAKLRRDVDGKTVGSTPVIIVVNAGLPDQPHFTIGPAQFNFAGYNWLGRTNEMSVQLGDIYSNPVKTGTAVYFNVTGGIIEAAAFTDVTGHSTNTLYSGNPLPNLPSLGAFPALYGTGVGYAYVRAHTLGQGGVDVKDSVLVLFSGAPVITLSGTTFTIPSGGAQTFSVKIADQNGNPLAPGTVIKTETQFTPREFTNWSAISSGLPDDPLDDFLTRGSGHTDFTLRVADGTPGGTPDYMPVVVKIRVTGPNGATFATITGTVGDTLSIEPKAPR